MREVEGRVAVVTGAASGIGFATATRFAEAGMKVVLADIEEPALNKAVESLQSEGHTVTGVPTDVSCYDSIKALAKATLDAYGQVNVVHNNAGVVVSGPIEDLTIADWEWVLGVDLWSVIYGIKVFLPLIKEAGEGHVVNTASTAGLQSAANIGPYNVSKFGVIAATETLKMELQAGETNVSCSVLCPGAVNTQIVMSHRNRDEASAKDHKSSAEEERFQSSAGQMLKEAGKDPLEVADMVMHAIREDEFWIITHSDWKDVLKERIRVMTESNQLHTGFGG